MDEKSLDLLIEQELYNEVRDIYNNTIKEITTEDKKRAARKAIEKFCETYQITDDEDIMHIFEKLEQMRQSEKKLKEERKKYDDEVR